MGDALWIPDAFRAAGLDVYEMPDWESCYTRWDFNPQGVVCHHTATGPNWLDGHVALLLKRGRLDLRGPLSQLGLERDGTFVCVGSRRCNHNGYDPDWGNDAYGIEAYNDGKGEPWPKVQMDAYKLGVSIICKHHKWGTNRVKGHKETTPGKVDPTFNMSNFRNDVFKLLTPKPPTTKDEEMEYLLEQATTGHTWLMEPGRRTLMNGDSLTNAKRIFPLLIVDDPHFGRLCKDRKTYQ